MKTKSKTIMPEGKLRQTWVNGDESGQLTIREQLRPSLIAMTICGCHKYEAGISKARKTKIETYRVVETGYRITCLLMCLAALAKACASFASLPQNFVFLNGMITVWHLQNFTMFLVSLKSSHIKYGGLTKAFEFWDTKIREELSLVGVELPEERFRRRQKVVLCVATILIIFNITGTILLIVDVFETDFSILLSAPFSKSIPIQVIGGFILASQTLIWILPFGYIVLVATFLTITFEELNKLLENLITENCFNMACEFRQIRLLHLNLSKMVSYLDKDFSCYFATLFVFGICLACFNLYNIVKTPMDTLNLMMTVFWLMSALTLLGIVSVSAAILNTEVGIIQSCSCYRNAQIKLSR